MTKILTEEQRAILLELVPGILGAREYTRQCEQDGDIAQPTSAEGRDFHKRVILEFHEFLAGQSEEQVDRALLDWWNRVADDVLMRFVGSPHLSRLLALPRRLQ
jgi:hypothetical protein